MYWRNTIINNISYCCWKVIPKTTVWIYSWFWIRFCIFCKLFDWSIYNATFVEKAHRGNSYSRFHRPTRASFIGVTDCNAANLCNLTVLWLGGIWSIFSGSSKWTSLCNSCWRSWLFLCCKGFANKWSERNYCPYFAP